MQWRRYTELLQDRERQKAKETESRLDQKVRSKVLMVRHTSKRMDIMLPVHRQLLKHHNYPDYGTWKPQYAP